MLEIDFLKINEDYLNILCAEKSLYEFVKQAWHIVEPTTPFEDGVHIRILCEYLEAVTADQIQNIAIFMPPRHMKSLTVSVFWFVWTWILRPGSQWIYTSSIDELCIRDSMKCRLLIESIWFRSRWGDKIALKRDQNEKSKFSNTMEGVRLCSAINTNVTGQNCNFLVGDDILDTKGVRSPAQRETVIFNWDNGFCTRLNDKRVDHKVLMQQRLHTKDPAGHIITNERGDWTFLSLPAEFKKKTIIKIPFSEEEITFEEGSILWESRFPREILAKEKARLGNNYAAQYLQDPIADGGLIFNTSLIPRIASVGNVKDCLQIVQSWDFAVKEKENNDYSACTTYGQLFSKKWVLLDVWKGKCKYSVQKQKAQDLAVKYKPQTILIEDKANGSPLISELKQYTSLPIKPIEPRGDKVTRAQLCTPFIEAGNLFLLDGQEWLHDLIMDLDGFPAIEYDDVIDTITQFCIWCLGISEKQKFFMETA